MVAEGAWLVTGASSGIGRALACRVAARGEAVVVAGRDVQALERLRQAVRARRPGAEIRVERLDVASRRSIDAFADRAAAARLRLAVLVNNAGVSMSHFGRCDDGFEWTWATNVRGPYLLSSALVGRGLLGEGAQVLNVGSSVHARRLDGRGFHRYGRLGGVDAYLQSKLCLILLTRALAAAHGARGIRVNCVHPGIVRSRLGRDGVLANLVGRAAGLLLPPARRAAQALERAAARVAATGLNGAWLDRGDVAEVGYGGDLDGDARLLAAVLARDLVPDGPASAWPAMLRAAGPAPVASGCRETG
jgi:NAD(P)-dependent dehydrogenase (short-subunit alcohol dehydrogenase family)